MKNILFIFIIANILLASSNNSNKRDYGVLNKMIGEWKTKPGTGMDIAPAHASKNVKVGSPAVSPFYETLSIKPVGSAVNASKQNIVGLSYVLQVYRISDGKKFHDQRGYLTYDKKHKIIYNDFCIPRNVCISSSAKEGLKMNFKAKKSGIAQSEYMLKHAKVKDFTMSIDLSKEGEISYVMTTILKIYSKKNFVHTDSSVLVKSESGFSSLFSH